MVNSSLPSLDATFAALSHPVRRSIVRQLAIGPMTTTELAKPFAMSLPAVLKHLRVLERAQLIVGDRQGRVHQYRLAALPMREATSWLEGYRAFWEAQLDALEAHVEEPADD